MPKKMEVSLSKIGCDVCDSESDSVIEIEAGEDYYDCETYICESCLRKAIALIEVRKMGRA